MLNVNIQPGTQKKIQQIFVLSFILHLLCAYFSAGFYHLDEHFQVLEFANYKLGRTPSPELAWEFSAHIRPWLQPFLAWLSFRFWLAVGIDNPFVWAAALRFASALLGYFSIWALWGWVKSWLKTESLLPWAAGLLSLLWFVPFLHARASSESWSASFFWIAFALFLTPAKSAPRATRFEWARYLAVGALCGLAFECRFQSAVLMAGLAAWQLIFRPTPWRMLRDLILAFVAVFILGRLVDYWGYGSWQMSPWNYFESNLIHGVAASMGVSPWWSYFQSLLLIYPPLSTILTLAVLVAVYRNPRHPLTWTCLPFLLLHCLIAHKEFRFLFPILSVLPLLIFAGDPAWLLRQCERRKKLFTFLLVLNFVPLLALSLMPAKSEISLYQFVYRQKAQPFAYYFIGANPFIMNDRIPRFYLPTLGVGSEIKTADLGALTSDFFYLVSSSYAELPPTATYDCPLVFSDLPRALATHELLVRTKYRPRLVYACTKK